MSLPDFLKEHGVLGVENIDTRALGVHLRDCGSLRGVISTNVNDIDALVAKAGKLPAPMPSSTNVPWAWRNGKPDTVDFIATQQSWSGQGLRVVVIDFGVDRTALRALEEAGCDLLMIPPDWSAAQIKELAPAFVIVSDGHSDPVNHAACCSTLAEVAKSIPVFAYGFGEIILGQAFGGKSHRLPHGHHGMNHPIRDLKNKSVRVTELCQRYALDINEAPQLEATYQHLHDLSLQGFCHKNLPACGWQFQPDNKMWADLVTWAKQNKAS